MICEDFALQLCGPTALSAEARAHASSCVRCRPLLALDTAFRFRGEEDDDADLTISGQLRAALKQNRYVARRSAPVRRALAPAAALAGCLTLVHLFARRPDAAKAPEWLPLLLYVGFIGMFASGLALVLARDRAGAGPSRRTGVLYLLAALLVYAGLSTVSVHVVGGVSPPRAFQLWLSAHIVPVLGGWVKHLPCSIVALVLGGCVLVATLWAGGRTATAAPGWMGTICGATAVMGTALVLLQFCSSHSPAHVLGVHGLSFSALVATGTVSGRRALDP